MADPDRRKTASDASVPELMSQLAGDLSELVRREVQLAKTEISEKMKGVGLGARLFGAAGAIGFWAVGALTATLILALGLVVPYALAALIVTVVYALIALVMFLTGRKKLKDGALPVPTETIEQVKEDASWLKERTSSGGS